MRKYTYTSAVNWLKRRCYQLRGYGVNGSLLSVYQSDVFLVGYPKSGNTWLDFLVACLRADNPEEVTFDSFQTNVADIYINTSKQLHRLKRPRYLKSHEPYDSRYPKVIYIVRDPRAVVVSYFHYLVGLNYNIKYDFLLEKCIPEFINGKFGGGEFGAWSEHVQGWLDAQKQYPDRVMIVKYESLKIDTEKTLSDIANFLGIKASSEKIKSSVLWASPENMRRLEVDARQLKNKYFDGLRNESYFIRQASSSGWKQELDYISEKKIITAWGGIMRTLDYIEE